MRKEGGIRLLKKAVQAAIYEKALKNHLKSARINECHVKG